MRMICFILMNAIVAVCMSAEVAEQTKPAPPSAAPPDIQQAKVTILCIGCPEPFDTDTHKEMLKGLAANPHIGELRKALYWQDSAHQFQSKAHFDNCDFDGAMDYIQVQLEDVDQHVKAAEAAKVKADKSGFDSAVRGAFFALGQALHGTQDFYAHTNYVELHIAGVSRVTDMIVVAPWRKNDRVRIGQLQKQGLVSGFVPWGFPQKCPSGTPSHSEMAKDSANTKSGRVKVRHLQNINQHGIAEVLARQASLNLLTDAFQRWPLLKDVNGTHVAFEVLTDRRGL